MFHCVSMRKVVYGKRVAVGIRKLLRDALEFSRIEISQDSFHERLPRMISSPGTFHALPRSRGQPGGAGGTPPPPSPQKRSRRQKCGEVRGFSAAKCGFLQHVFPFEPPFEQFPEFRRNPGFPRFLLAADRASSCVGSSPLIFWCNPRHGEARGRARWPRGAHHSGRANLLRGASYYYIYIYRVLPWF